MYKRILLAVDLDAPDSRIDALPTAVALARCFSAELTLCTVVRDVEAALETEWSSIGYRQILDVAKARLAALASQIPDLVAGTEIGTGSICAGILEAAARRSADLIVLASHRHELSDYLLGANAARVVRHAPCSVLVVRSSPAEAPHASVPKRAS